MNNYTEFKMEISWEKCSDGPNSELYLHEQNTTKNFLKCSLTMSVDFIAEFLIAVI